MDPTACLKNILCHLDKDDDNYDEEEARYLAEALLKWLGNGGFPPEMHELSHRERRLLAALACTNLVAGVGIGLALSVAGNC